MKPFIPKQKLGKKARRQLDSAQRATWAFSPVTKKVESKKYYSRKRKAHDRYDDYGMGFFCGHTTAARNIGIRRAAVHIIEMMAAANLYESRILCYTAISDRVAETCEACDRGNPCGGSPFSLDIRQMDQILSVLTKYRNACAHGERLFSYTTRDDIPDLPLHAKLGIARRGNQYVHGKHDLFAVVIAFRYLLPSDSLLAFKQALSIEIDRFSQNCSSLSQRDLLSAMGFPPNWKNISRRYKL